MLYKMNSKLFHLMYTDLARTKQEIHLLELFPGDREAQIDSGLSRVRLDRAQNFDPLSYIWGETLRLSQLK